ncbi:MAG TPA: hypothetical protein VGL77_10010, partial [Armatimonadota bacterium]
MLYRLLLPGIRLKRWVLVHVTGMLLFAIGLWSLLLPQWKYKYNAMLWEFWWHVIHEAMPPIVVILFGIVLLM